MISLPIIQHIFDTTILWHTFLKQFPKHERYGVGERTMSHLLDAIREAQYAQFSTERSEKLIFLSNAIRSINAVIIIVRLCNEIQVFPDKKFFVFSEKTNNAVKMLGGWKRNVMNPKSTILPFGRDKN